MKKIFLFLLSSIIWFVPIKAQDCKYTVLEAAMSGSDDVALTLNIDVKDKKILEKEAEFAALKVLIFDGVPNTKYNRPFLKDGYKAAYTQNPTYFQTLYNNIAPDFVKEYEALSKFRKSNNNTTKVRVIVKPLVLRRNLETNGILKRIGL